MEAAELFEVTLRWLQSRYSDYRFFAERDLVWTVHLRLLAKIEESGLPYRVFNDHTIRQGLRADLVILDGDSLEVAAEFKYEPSHERDVNLGGDIWTSKFPVVFWTGEGSVQRDVQRVRDYVQRGNAKASYSVFIDEGGSFRHRNPHRGSRWTDWGQGVWVLLSRWHDGGGKGDVPFDQLMNEYQTEWRRTHLDCTEWGEQLGQRRSWILPRDQWELGLWPGIRTGSGNSLPDYLERNDVQKHGGAHNLKSSWTQCANMYFPFRASKEGRSLFASFLREHVDQAVSTLDTIELEFAEPKGSKLHPSCLLGEKGGKRGARQTSPDLGLRVNGCRGLILVESKFTEQRFDDCSAWRHKTNQKPERCDHPREVAEDPTGQCHQTALGRRYWQHLADEVDTDALAALRLCPAARHGYQLFRQQALAKGIARSGEYDLVATAVAIDERNGEFEAALRRIGIDGFEHWGKIFGGRTGFAVFTHQQWFGWVTERDTDGHWSDWRDYVADRYALGT